MKASNAIHWIITLALLVIVVAGGDRILKEISDLKQSLDKHSHALIAKDKKGNPVIVDNAILSPEFTRAATQARQAPAAAPIKTGNKKHGSNKK